MGRGKEIFRREAIESRRAREEEDQRKAAMAQGVKGSDVGIALMEGTGRCPVFSSVTGT
jgi:hypothetical protein